MPQPTRYVVYTGLFGDAEDTHHWTVPNRQGIDFLCFTDNPNRTSPLWTFVPVQPAGLDKVREARRVKHLAHEFLAGYDASLYIDNTIRLLQDPADIFAQYLPPEAEAHLACVPHPWRACAYDEAETIIAINYDDEHRIIEQMTHYARQGFPRGAGLIASGFLLRRHHHPDVRRLGQQWFYHVLRYAQRDQLAFNFVAWQMGFQYATVDVNLMDNPVFHWQHDIPRLPKGFDGDTYRWLHADVAASGMDPAAHYKQYGRHEGRRIRYFEPPRLNQLANLHGAPRGNLHTHRHFYTRVYEPHLAPLREAAFTLVEIGPQPHAPTPGFLGAPAVHMWEAYFPNATVLAYGAGAVPAVETARTRLAAGAPGDRAALANLVTAAPAPLHVVIDNGGHPAPAQQTALGYLWQHLAPGGLYIIENLQFGSHAHTPRTQDILKEAQQTGRWASPDFAAAEAAALSATVASVTFYDSMDYMSPAIGQDALAIIRKRADAPPATPPPV